MICCTHPQAQAYGNLKFKHTPSQALLPTYAAAVSIFLDGTLHASRVVMTWLVLDSGMSAEYAVPLHSTL
jgi:hypothetical protein